MKNLGNYTLHSGGAHGSDISWQVAGEDFGLVKCNHYYYGNRTPHGNFEISQADYDEGQIKATLAARLMGRIEPTHQIRNHLIIRNWAQVKYSDAVYAIGNLLDAGDELDYGKYAKVPQLAGGTGYAVQMAVMEGKPVFIYDQLSNHWFKMFNSGWHKSDIPILTINFAGIGTRQITQEGLIAMYRSFQVTSNNLNHENNATGD